MRPLRAAFVLTLAAACSRTNAPVSEPSRNPPELPRAPEVADVPAPPTTACPPRQSIVPQSPCSPTGLECYLPTGGCQPSGFSCREGVWHEVQVTCNPPPPPGE